MNGTDGSGVEEYEWDPCKRTATTWSTANSRLQRGRRAYGRGNTAVGAARRKRRATHQESHEEPDDEGKEYLVEESPSSIFVSRQCSDSDSLDFSRSASTSSLSSSLSFPDQLQPVKIVPQLTRLPSRERESSYGSRNSNRAPLSRRPSQRTKQSQFQQNKICSMEVRCSGENSEGAENVHPNSFTSGEKVDEEMLSNFFSRETTQQSAPSSSLNSSISNVADDISLVDMVSTSKKKKKIHQCIDNERAPSPAFSTPSQSSSSFTSLAISGGLAASWAKNSTADNEPFCKDSAAKLDNCKEMNSRNESTPRNFFPSCGEFGVSPPPLRDSTSCANSLKQQRGVCASPSFLLDQTRCDFSPTSLQSCRSSSAGDSIVESRSYLSILSSSPSRHKEAHQGPKLTSSKQEKEKNCRRKKCDLDNDEDDDDDGSPQFASISNSSSSDLANSDFEHDDVVVLPPVPERKGSSNFDEIVFGAMTEFDTEATPSKRHSASLNCRGDAMMASIPSQRDLVFVLKILRKNEKSKKNLGFGSNRHCTIVPSGAWKPDRKGSFLKWATKSLGFSLRSAGGGIDFLQVPSEKASEIRKFLESALIERKKGIVQNELSNTKENKNSNPFIRSRIGRSGCIPRHVTAPHSSSGTKQMTMMFQQLHSPSFDREVHTGHTDLHTELSTDFNSLQISDKSENLGNIKVSHTTNVHNQELHVRSFPVYSPEACIEECSNYDDEALLGNEMTLDTSFEVSRRPRFSAEYAVGGEDFVKHLHGVSPNDNSQERFPRRPPRLLIPSKSCGARLSTGSGCKTSPFPQSIQHSLTSEMSIELTETPMPKKSSGFSCWTNGKDWGESRKCDPTIISELMRCFDQAFSDGADDPLLLSANKNCSIDHNRNHTPSTGPFSLLDSCTSDLGFADEICNGRSFTFASHERDVDVNEYIVAESNPSLSTTELNRRYSCDPINLSRISSRKKKCSRRLSVPDFIGRASFEEPKRCSKLTEICQEKKQRASLAKHERVSISTSALDIGAAPRFSLMNKHAFRPSISKSMSSQSEPFSLCPVNKSPSVSITKTSSPKIKTETNTEGMCHRTPTLTKDILPNIFDYLCEEELLCIASLVCIEWANIATDAHAKLMLISVGCSTSFLGDEDEEDIDNDDFLTNDDEVKESDPSCNKSIAESMERSWKYLNAKFPWGAFLSEGAFKKVFRVWNSTIKGEEAVSVMDVEIIESTGNKSVVGAELAVSVLLSSLTRRNICPNFVVTRGVFTCPFAPPPSHWGSAEEKKPLGSLYDPEIPMKKPRKPGANKIGRYQYIRMELCRFGDVEEYVGKQPGKSIDENLARIFLFQMAFSLHTASDRIGMKHYDIKLLNFFLQSANDDDVDIKAHSFTVLRYGVGEHVFNMRMPTSKALLVKLADYGTANLRPESNGQPVTLGQFTTLENSPPEQLLMGDAAVQSFGHDMFGLGLCMIHLFTGHAPYEEVMEEVTCPPNLKRSLRKIYENKSSKGFTVIRSVILSDVYEDEDGNTEGDADEVLYDTLYRFLVLFGIPSEKFDMKLCGKIWRAITSTLGGNKYDQDNDSRLNNRRKVRGNGDKKSAPDMVTYHEDQSRFSLLFGDDERIARAREKLTRMEGGMELLNSLVVFDPDKRASALDVLNSAFMAPLREMGGTIESDPTDIVYSYMAYSTDRGST